MTQYSLKILMVSVINPLLHRGGAGTVTRNLLKILQGYELNAQIEYIILKSPFENFHQLRQVTSIAKSFISSLPAKVIFTYSQSFIKDIKQKLQEQTFDLVLINGSDLLWLLSELPSHIPKILIAHNIEHRLFESQIKSLNLPGWMQEILLRDCQRLQVHEMSGFQKVKNIICLSYSEETFILENYPHLNTITIPPVFDYQPAERTRFNNSDEIIDIGFLGIFNWWPNKHGLNWFLNHVFPYTKVPVRLHLFGEQSQELHFSSPQIINHGFVPKIQDVWSFMDLMICPIFVGGGVNIKFAEAVYNGVPILASTFAARGLRLQPDPSIVLLDSADDWISFLDSVNVNSLRQKQIYVSLSNLFSAKLYIESVQSFVQEVVQGVAIQDKKY